jgi:hypothetical protein
MDGLDIATSISRLRAASVGSSRAQQVRRHRIIVIIKIMRSGRSRRELRARIRGTAGGRGAAHAFAMTIIAARSRDIGGGRDARRVMDGLDIATSIPKLHAASVGSSRAQQVRRHRIIVIIKIMRSRRSRRKLRARVRGTAGGRRAAHAFAMTIITARRKDIGGGRERAKGLAVLVGAANV